MNVAFLQEAGKGKEKGGGVFFFFLLPGSFMGVYHAYSLGVTTYDYWSIFFLFTTVQYDFFFYVCVCNIYSSFR